MAERPAEKGGGLGFWGLGSSAPAATPVFITGVGLRCPLGLSALHAAMLVRAHMGEPRSTRFLDKRQRHIGVHLAPGLRGDLHGYDRMIALSAPALRAAVSADAPSATWPLLLALPEKGRPDDDPRFASDILQGVSEASGVALDLARSRTLRMGHAGAAIALAMAVEELSKGAPGVVVGAVDSYYHADVLAWLDEECRLHALDAENGFVPGEAGAFLVLTSKLPVKAPRPRGAGETGAQPAKSGVGETGTQAAKSGVGETGAQAARGGGDSGTPALLRRVELGREETVVTDDPNIGGAMTAILRDLALAAPGGKLGWSLTDVNGERHRVREWGLSAGRGAFADDAVHHRPVDDLGDLGAATGAALAALAIETFRAGAAPKSSACVALASDGPERGAFLLGFEGGAP